METKNLASIIVEKLRAWGFKFQEETEETPAYDSFPSTGKKFGTFSGVFLPSILTILGVVMYLRMGWVVGNVGIFQTFWIVTLSSSITFLTALSISATASNMKVGAGGAYYMISRSFGLESGAAVGLPLYMAQAIGIAFYITGFSESVHFFLPFISPALIGLVVLVGITLLAYFSADVALKIQLFIFLLILGSLVAIFSGSPVEGFQAHAPKIPSHDFSFWTVFAVFFPAVTGILSGVSMSGDLKAPGKSIPIGTISAVVIGYVVYLAIPWVLWHSAPISELVEDSMVLKKIASFAPAIYAGLWGATLSSALGSMLAAPRTLKALSYDRIVPSMIGKSSASGSPQTATLFTFILAACCILLGDLNLIAPVLTMFFLVTYCILNLVSGTETLLGSPTWRPTIRVPWPVSFTGAAGCLGVMLMINAGATYIAMLVCGGLYFWVRQREIRTNFTDMRPSMLLYSIRNSLYQLENFKLNERSWRPSIVLVTGMPQKSVYLLEIADGFSRNKGLMTLGVSFDKDVEALDDPEKVRSREKMLEKWMGDRNIKGLVKIGVGFDETTFTEQLIRFYGLGSVKPNIFLYNISLGEEVLSQCMKLVYRNKRNGIVIRGNDIDSISEITDRIKKPQMNIWWSQHQEESGSFMLTLAHLLRGSEVWKESKITIYTVIDDESKEVSANRSLDFLVAGSRLRNLEQKVLIRKDKDFFEVVAEQSKYADVTFMGIPQPKIENEDYTGKVKNLFDHTTGLGLTIYAMAGENVNLKKVFVD